MEKIVKKPFTLPDKVNYPEMFYLILFYCTVLYWHFWGMCGRTGGKKEETARFLVNDKN